MLGLPSDMPIKSVVKDEASCLSCDRFDVTRYRVALFYTLSDNAVRYDIRYGWQLLTRA